MSARTAKILRHWWLLTVATVAQCVVAAALRGVSLSRLRSGSRACHGLARILVPDANAPIIAWAVEATGRRLGRASSCLVRALVTQMLLEGAGEAVSLSLGVKHTTEGALQAHAWVTRAGRIVVGAPVDEYLPIVTWTDAREPR